MIVITVIITPAKAHELLAKNELNRNLRQRAVDRFARDMSTGNWLLNGDPIRVSTAGDLLDGQHRLHACIQAKKSFETLMISDLDEEVRSTIDTGARRSTGDMLKLRGEINSNSLAQAGLWLWKIEQGDSAIRSTFRPTNAELVAVIDRWPGVRRYVNEGRTLRKITRGIGIFAAFMTVVHQKTPEKADSFWQGLVTGENLASGSPILALREKLITLRHDPKGRIANTWYYVQMCAYAWRAYYKGRTLTRVSPRPDKPIPKFPGAPW